jgi:tRNA threonylcarbamoyladenosine modification (KEOPS) complex  Pcc1 subunit
MDTQRPVITLTLHYNTPDATTLYRTLKVEEEHNERFQIVFKKVDYTLICEVKARDVTAARAAVNTVLRYLQMLEKVK